MSEPAWVTSAEVTLINQKETAVTNEPHGIVKPNELDSACDRARNYYAYGETDTYRLAATYAEGVAQNHPFEQGNKRSAFMAAHLFLAKNGIQLLPREDDGYVVMMRDLVNHERSRDDVASYLAENSREIVREQGVDDHIARVRERLAQDRERSRDGTERD